MKILKNCTSTPNSNLKKLCCKRIPYMWHHVLYIVVQFKIFPVNIFLHYITLNLLKRTKQTHLPDVCFNISNRYWQLCSDKKEKKNGIRCCLRYNCPVKYCLHQYNGKCILQHYKLWDDNNQGSCPKKYLKNHSHMH